MGTVFAAFILSADRIPKEFGLLLAVAILTDALIVRMTLVPAFLTLLGEKSWYIPRWLDRLLPNITIEPPHDGDGSEASSGSDTRAGRSGLRLPVGGGAELLRRRPGNRRGRERHGWTFGTRHRRDRHEKAGRHHVRDPRRRDAGPGRARRGRRRRVRARGWSGGLLGRADGRARDAGPPRRRRRRVRPSDV